MGATMVHLASTKDKRKMKKCFSCTFGKKSSNLETPNHSNSIEIETSSVEDSNTSNGKEDSKKFQFDDNAQDSKPQMKKSLLDSKKFLSSLDLEDDSKDDSESLDLEDHSKDDSKKTSLIEIKIRQFHKDMAERMIELLENEEERKKR